MLLEDVFVIERLQVLNEDTDKGKVMKIRGVFQRADEENNNKRIYPKALLEREISKLNESLKGRRLMGELDHPQHDSVKLSNVSHLITKLEAKGNEIIGEAEILDTPMGKVAKALIEGGVQIGISSRGMGTLSEGQDGKRYVNEDFRLITWDLVADPSTRGAFPSLAESRQSVLVEEIMNNVLPRVTKEKVFSTLLVERLDEAKMKSAKKKAASKKEKNNPWAICTAQVGRKDPKKYERCVMQVKSKSKGANPELATENTSMLKLKGLLKEQGNPYGSESEKAIKDRINAVSKLRKRMVAQGKSPQEIAAAVAKASQGK